MRNRLKKGRDQHTMFDCTRHCSHSEVVWSVIVDFKKEYIKTLDAHIDMRLHVVLFSRHDIIQINVLIVTICHMVFHNCKKKLIK